MNLQCLKQFVSLHVKFLGLFKENFNLNSSFNSIYSFLLAISRVAVPKQSIKRSYTPLLMEGGFFKAYSIWMGLIEWHVRHLNSSKQSSHHTYIDNKGPLLVFTLFFVHVNRYQWKQWFLLFIPSWDACAFHP